MTVHETLRVLDAPVQTSDVNDLADVETRLGLVSFVRMSDNTWKWFWRHTERAPDDFDSVTSDAAESLDDAVAKADQHLRGIDTVLRRRGGQRFECWLCVQHAWDKEKQEMVFSGFRIFSWNPWAITSIGFVHSALLCVTSTASFNDAEQRLFASVAEFAEFSDYWRFVWRWIDPSREAHEARFEMYERITAQLVARGIRR